MSKDVKCEHEHEHEHGCCCHGHEHEHEHEHEHDCCCGHDHEHEHEQHHHDHDHDCCHDHSCGCGCGCGHDHAHSTDDIKKDIIFIVTSAVLTLVGVLFLEGIARTIVLLAAYLIVGGEILWNALKGLLRGNIVDENVLMSVATIGAIALGDYGEGVMVMLLYRIGELLQGIAVGRSQSSIKEVLDLRPDTVRLEENGEFIVKHADEAKAGGVRVMATGRSDFPNQVNNVLCFPGLFKGALSVRARDINNEMKLAAAYAIADLITDADRSEENIIPGAFDPRVAEAVANAVAKAARETGVARL